MKRFSKYKNSEDVSDLNATFRCFNEEQLVDPETSKVISKPYKVGELWTNGPRLTVRLTEYYNNPDATARAFTADGWYKTGDLLYRDRSGHYFFVERMTSAFKVGRYYVMPMEVEKVIQSHPDVVDACVVGVPDLEDDGKRAAAVVVRRPGSSVSEQDIKTLVANALPRSFSSKVKRQRVQDLAQERPTRPHLYDSKGHKENQHINSDEIGTDN